MEQQCMPGLGFEFNDAAGTPAARGVYLPEMEKDSCGTGFVARLDGIPRHDLVEQAVQVLINLEHRGALGGDGMTGDGAGLLMQIPDAFFRAVGPALPAIGDYAVGMVFLPVAAAARNRCQSLVSEAVAAQGMALIGWREVPP